MATATLYNSFKKKLLDGSGINLASDTIKVALVGAGYTPDKDVHDFWDDVSGNESSGTGYTAGGATLANPAVTQDNTNDKGKFDADDSAWTISSSLSARYAVIYKSTGTPSTSALIAYIDLGATYTLASGVLTLTWSANGVLTIA